MTIDDDDRAIGADGVRFPVRSMVGNVPTHFTRGFNMEPETIPIAVDDVPDGHIVCETCGDHVAQDDSRDGHCASHYVQCVHCEEDVHEDDAGRRLYWGEGLRRPTESMLCVTCYNRTRRCEDCGAEHMADDGHSLSGDHVCGHCFEHHWTTCERCDDAYRMDDGPRCHCNDESDEGEDEDSLLRDYSTRVPSRCYGKGPRFYGVELEVESTSERARAVEWCHGVLPADWMLTKKDGSLDDDRGFEIVTFPGDWAHQQTWWGAFFKASPKRWVRSWDTEGRCGLHVHVSKSSLSPMSLGRLLCFINEPRHRGFVQRIAGREPNIYQQPMAKTMTSALPRKQKGDRYQWLNLNNAKTVEFRMFRGSIRPESFWRCLEFVRASCEWASIPNGMTWSLDSFKSHVEKSKKDYPHLFEFMFPDRKAVPTPLETTEG